MAQFHKIFRFEYQDFRALSLRRVVIFLVASATSLSTSAQADSFGTGPNTFDIEFVTIGDPGNPGDPRGFPLLSGSVDRIYRIGKFEISESMIDRANAETAETNSLNISHDGRGTNKPATSVSWFEAAKFVNWLNVSTSNTPAYKFNDEGVMQLWEIGDAGYDPNNVFRNRLSKSVLTKLIFVLLATWVSLIFFAQGGRGNQGLPRWPSLCFQMDYGKWSSRYCQR